MTIPATMVNGKLVYVEDTVTQNIPATGCMKTVVENLLMLQKKPVLISHAFGLSAAHPFDYNGDGWPDIYVANDFNKPDFFLHQ
jgi:hypothetical protein